MSDASPKSPSNQPKSPAKSPTKRTAEQKGSAKKGKGEDGNSHNGHSENEYSFNINNSLDKEHEGKSLKEIIKLPPSALEGLADRADAMLAAFKINTIEDLANWRFYKIAKAISILSSTEEKGKRHAESKANINAALDKEYERASLKDIVKAKVSALQGLADWADSTLSPLGVKTINDLARWKFAEWASALVELAQYENADFSSA